MSLLTKPSDEENNVPTETTESLPAVDAVAHVSIADGGLESSLHIEPPINGGAAPTLKDLESALKSCGVTYNIDAKKLQELALEPIYGSDIVIAHGISSINGSDGTATFHIDVEKKLLKPKENEDGNVDYHDLGIVENVIKDQVLCIITPPTDGTAGISVKGNVLLQKKGKPVPSYLGKNTYLSEDGTAILSKIDGQVDFAGRKISVNETYIVRENVDNSTGDIKVAGNLVVRGMVMPGFKIEAGNHIDVYGTIESSTIKAGGSVKLLSGITGSELYCEGDLKSRFIENCTVFVKGDIKAEYVLNSNIKCGKTLKTDGSISKIIGGKCLVGQNIEARIIGSASNVKTKLELGTDPATIERQQELLAQMPVLEKQIESLKPLIALLRELESSNRLTSEKKELLCSVGASYDANVKLLEESKIELVEISQSIHNRGYGRVICTGAIYPGTNVSIGAASLSVADTLNNTSLFYMEGSIRQGSAQ